MNPLNFQEKAVDELIRYFKELWGTGRSGLEIVFKSPTGSGKTFMVSDFIRQMNHQPDWDADKAWIWVTFSDDLAMQSRQKFQDYFVPNQENRLLTLADINCGVLQKNDILFMNWQKLVSRRAEDRRLRRPEDERLFKESGFYFEDLVENTHNEGREIILIIDESHKNVTDSARRDVIDPIRPRILLKVSATPKDIPNAEAVANQQAAFVQVHREDVVAEGLIKDCIVCQTDEDLRQHRSEDLDTLLLELAMSRQTDLRREYRRLGRNVNPLVLIQLPNDDRKVEAVRTKEQVVTEFLQQHGVPENRIAYWFDQRRENMDFIEANDSNVDFLLFKQAAGTGWDCPRAQVLVMYREITSPTFYTQTLGRILRMPEPREKDIYAHAPMLRAGYLFTNYNRDEVQLPDQTKNAPKTTFISENRFGEEFVLHEKLKTEFLSRVDYGDIGEVRTFQRSMCASFDRFFGIGETGMSAKNAGKLEARGVDLRPHLTNKLIVNAEFENFDNIQTEIKKKGNDTEFEISTHDVEKIFTLLCIQLLREQGPETKITNVARSWGPFKSMLRTWLGKTLNADSDYYYRVFINDVQKDGHSVFRQAITQSLKEYRPVLEEFLQKRNLENERRNAEPFVIHKNYYFTDDFEEVETRRSLLRPFYLRKNYPGRSNEKAFVDFLEDWEKVDWWFKNADSGKDGFALKYLDSTSKSERLFYPDWIVKFLDGRIGIFDTKEGQTANSNETGYKAEALQKFLQVLNQEIPKPIFFGGIVVPGNGMWYLNQEQTYEPPFLGFGEGWRFLTDCEG